MGSNILCVISVDRCVDRSLPLTGPPPLGGDNTYRERMFQFFFRQSTQLVELRRFTLRLGVEVILVFALAAHPYFNIQHGALLYNVIYKVFLFFDHF